MSSWRYGAAVAAPPRLNTVLASNLPPAEGDAALVAIEDALQGLEALDPPLAEIVEMRYFAGASEGESAELTEQSERTVRRRWEKARAFLLAALQP